jgi:hypothetical protein
MGVLIPILVLGHGFEERLHRPRPQRSGLGDGNLAAIRCYKVFLAFPKVQQPSEKPATPAADATGEQLSELPQAQPAAVRSPGSPMTPAASAKTAQQPVKSTGFSFGCQLLKYVLDVNAARETFRSLANQNT